MAIGTYGVVRPSDVSVNDIDIYYNYTPNRETFNDIMYKINEVSEIIQPITLPEEDDNYEGGGENLLEGLYNLTLPASIFNELGIYTIYVRPKVHKLDMKDCGVLSAMPTVKGVVIDKNELPEDLRNSNALQGHKIEYLDEDGDKRRNLVRYVVTSYKVSPINENVGNTSQKAVRYRFDDSGTLLFLQVTPSSSSDVKPSIYPFIGNVGDTILISNTSFSPVVMEVELVKNTLDTIANIIAGEQIKDVKNGILTYYDENRVITKQFDLFKIKDDVSDVPLFEVKERRTNIDTTQDFDDIIDEVN